MLRGWVILMALALFGERALAQAGVPVASQGPTTTVRTGPIAVAATDASAAANESLLELLGAEAFRIEVPTSFDPDPLLDFCELVPGEPELVVVLAVDLRRVIVVVPDERRFLERILPTEITAADAYPIALAATELLEIAGWAPPELRPPIVETVEPPPIEEPEVDDPIDPEPEVIPPEPREPVRFELDLGASGWLGLPTGLEELDLRLAFGVVFPDRLGSARWFVAGSLAGFGHDTVRPVLDGYPTTAIYARRAFGLRGGLAFRHSRWELRPFGSVSLEWVHVDANQREAGVAIGEGTDDRLAATLGIGLDSRVHLTSLLIAGASVGIDALPGRTTYTGFGSAIFDEPPARVTVTLILGVTWPRGP